MNELSDKPAAERSREQGGGQAVSGAAGDNHWLTRPATIRKLWWVFAAVLALTVLAQFLIPVKGKFPLESTFAFAAWYGFFCCVAMVLAARVLGWWLKRPESYYAETGIEPPPQVKDQPGKAEATKGQSADDGGRADV